MTPIRGNAAAQGAFAAAIDSGALHHAWLFAGPEGVGKATFAFDVARVVFGRTGDESPEHVAAQVAAGAYPNLRVLRKAPRDTGKGFYTAIRVEEVRSLIEEARMTRGRAGFRIVIVDSIDDCNPSSANALLKILEEPPPETLFLLVSHKPGGLLPTIRSRCQQVALRPLADAEVRAVLGEGPAVEHAVELAAGRPRRGFEALALGDNAGLTALQGWLRGPENGGAAVWCTCRPAWQLRQAASMAVGDSARAVAICARSKKPGRACVATRTCPAGPLVPAIWQAPHARSR